MECIIVLAVRKDAQKKIILRLTSFRRGIILLLLLTTVSGTRQTHYVHVLTYIEREPLTT